MSNRVTRRGHKPTPRSRHLDGVCAEETCRIKVGKENLVNVCDRWICVACGEAEIRAWNDAVGQSTSRRNDAEEQTR